MFLLCNTTRNFPDKYQGKKFPSSPNSITLPASPRSRGCLGSPAHSETHQRGQEGNDGSCHSSNLSILLTYDMIDFPSERSNTGLSPCVFHCGNG